jgi:ActR/RegA family two-component response regulator
MAEMNPDVDRRRFPRWEILATAVVFSPDRLHGTYVVQNMSAGGAFLIGGASLTVGASVTVLVQLQQKCLGTMAARVVRRCATTSAGASFAIAFMDLNADEEDAIQQALMGEIEKMRTRAEADVMIMYPEGATRDALQRDLRKVGHASVAVATPLEAIGWLQRSPARIRTVIIDLSLGPARGVDMLQYLCEQHPEVHRVLIAEDERSQASSRSFRLELALRSGRAHMALPKPWTGEQIEEAVKSESHPVVAAAG